ncbi:MAG: hypothetical protein K5777_06135 [Nitrosopumilus sp.]|nr:hypothetical protein [Nitrosopumilus sp.]
MVHYYISQIKHIPQKPSQCVSCKKSDLKDDAVLATTGPSEKYADYVPSTLCLSCETLMIITSHPGAVVGVNHTTGNQVTVRER